MPEFITNLLQNAGAIELVAGTVLAVLGVRNREQIMAVIKSLLNGGKDGGKDGDKPGPSPLPVPDWWPVPDPSPDPRPPLYDTIDAYTVLRDQAIAKGHTECRRKLDEVLHHLLTDADETPNPEPAHA